MEFNTFFEHNGLDLESVRDDRDGPVAGGGVLNSELVGSTLQKEEAVVGPVVAPGVTDDPVLLALVGLAVSYHGDLVVVRLVGAVVNEDGDLGRGVPHLEPPVHERGGVQGACNGTTCSDLLHHGSLPSEGGVLRDLEGRVVGDGGAPLSGHAVLAGVDVGALIAGALGDVVLAGVRGETGLVGVLVDGCGEASSAAVGKAVHSGLDGELNIGPGTLAHDADPVSNRRRARHRPAAAAVRRDVLVDRLRHPVAHRAAVHACRTPVPRVGDVRQREVVSGLRRLDDVLLVLRGGHETTTHVGGGRGRTHHCEEHHFRDHCEVG